MRPRVQHSNKLASRPFVYALTVAFWTLRRPTFISIQGNAGFACDHYAETDMTAQFHERLILNGERTTMAFCPPLPSKHPRVVELSDREIDEGRKRASEESKRAGKEEGVSEFGFILGSTACWRRYVGTWEVRDGQFFLTSIEGRLLRAWLLERVPAARRALGPLLASRFLIVSQYDGDKTRRQPLEMPGRYRFHSTRPAPWKRVSVASSVGSPRAE
jgi:hypothetical protein